MIAPNEIRESLKTAFVGRTLYAFDVVESTNETLKELAEAGATEGTTAIAEYQTAGRGRFKRTWYSERGKNVLLSILLRPSERETPHVLTYLAALATAEALEKEIGRPVELKWPNDLLLSNKKVCGILLESAWDGTKLNYVIVGIGVNVNQENFSADLQQKATSLKIECGREFNRAEIVREILERLEFRYLELQAHGSAPLLEAWMRKSSMFGKEIAVEQSGRKIVGKALHLDPDGALVMNTPQGETRLFAGDVTVLE